MKQKITFLGGSVLVVAILCSALFLKSRSQVKQESITRSDTPARTIEQGTPRILHPASRDELKNLIDQANKDGKLLILDFFATWCPPCRMLGPVLEELAGKYPSVIIAKIDVDEHQDLTQEYRIKSMPTLFFISCGDIKKTIHGYKSKAELSGEIEKLMGKK